MYCARPWATAPAITPARSSPGSASSSCACRRIATAGSSTELFERYQRSERALVATLAEMYVQGVSTRKVKAITEELCGHAFSGLRRLSHQQASGRKPRRTSPRAPLPSPSPTSSSTPAMKRCARAAWSSSQAVLIAVGIDWDGRRQILGRRHGQPRERLHSWKDFLLALLPPRPQWRRVRRRLRSRRPSARPFARSSRRRPCSDATCTSSESLWTIFRARPTTTACRSCAWLYDRRNVEEARRDLAAWVAEWGERVSLRSSFDWVEETIEEPFTLLSPAAPAP